MTRNHDHTPPHGIERPEAEALQRAMDEWVWPASHGTTWTDVAKLVARLDNHAVAAGHPPITGRLRLEIPDPGVPATITRTGSTDRIPGGAILATTPAASHAMLVERLRTLDDLAAATQDTFRLHALEGGRK